MKSLGCNEKFDMCCFKHLLLHSVYIKLSAKQIAKSDKISAWAVSETKTQVTHYVFAPKVSV